VAIGDSAAAASGDRHLVVTRSLDTALRGSPYYVLVVNNSGAVLYQSPTNSQLNVSEREALREVASSLDGAVSPPNVARLGSRRIALSARNVPAGLWPAADLVVSADNPDPGLGVVVFSSIICLVISGVAIGVRHVLAGDALGLRRRIAAFFPSPPAPGSQVPAYYDDPSTGRTVMAVGLGVLATAVGLVLSMQGVAWFLGTLLTIGGGVAFLYNWRTEASVADTLGVISLSLALTASISLLTPLGGLLTMWLSATDPTSPVSPSLMMILVSLPIAWIGGVAGRILARVV
jgi:hypothetical protein